MATRVKVSRLSSDFPWQWKCPACRQWEREPGLGLSNTIRAAAAHWRDCPALRLQRLLDDACRLADDWRYKGEFGWGPWQLGEGPDQEGWFLDQASCALRELLHRHEAKS
jgi:hypothetical protein